MEKLSGTVSKIRVLQLNYKPLIRFTLENTNCLIATHSLNFLAEVDEKMNISVIGYYNSRKQFVVKNYKINNTSKIVLEFERSSYPNRKIY